MKWVAREHLNVDPVASSWLIKTCVDPYAEFLLVPEADLVATAERVGATPFDAARWREVKLNHRHHRCTFEVMLEHFKRTDPALHRIGHIVRAAVNGQEHIAPESLGLRAIAEGFASLGLSDDERLRLQFPVYDALDAYARQRAG